ncbi:MAG: PIN domain-containing protein [Actinomycetota bacterium]
MRCFADTSALIALLNADDEHHARARARWQRLLTTDASMITSNYVILETFILAQHRLGMQAARDFNDAVVPVLNTAWITEEVHNTAAASLIISGKRNLSLVDCTSFEICRRLGIENAFAYDRHFRDQGFKLIN